MRHGLISTFHLTVKELRSIKADPIMIGLIVFVFAIVIPLVSDSISTEIKNVAVAVINEDRSQLSGRLVDAIQPPMFIPPDLVAPGDIADAMNRGTYVLALVIPPGFESDILAGNQPVLQILVDATAIAHAGNGAAYLQTVITQEIGLYLSGGANSGQDMVNIVFRTKFNPNSNALWFATITQLMNNVTILTLILAGAALIREREHGTVEHLLVMPVTPSNIMISKILANGLIVLVGAVGCLVFLIQGVMGVPVFGSIWLFILGTALYTVSVASLGILLATYSASMAQFGLLSMPVIVVMMLLSGGFTPLDSMPRWIFYLDHLISPTPHFVAFAQAVLYRGAGVAIVWPQLASIIVLGVAYFAIALRGFKRAITSG